MMEPIEVLLAEREIRRLITLFCRGADRADSTLLRSVLHDDAYIDSGPFKGGAGDFGAWAAGSTARRASQHLIANMLIEIDGDHAEVETYCVALHGGVPCGAEVNDSTVFVRYLDQVDRRGGHWRISRHVVVWDWNHHMPSTACWEGPVYGQCTLRPKPGRNDPSYFELPLIGRLR
jgi:hypothetical protein